MLFFVLVSLAAASGPLVTLDAAQTAECITDDGYLPSGTDCCKFIVCDAATFNKTGYEGTCMGGTVWNDDLKVCDDEKYVGNGCLPSRDCNVPKKTTALCVGVVAPSCCVNGREPVYTLVAGTDNEFTVDGFRGSNTCPADETFNLGDCCCEPETNTVCTPPAWQNNDDGLDGNGAADDNSCCSFEECDADGNGWHEVFCMPPSVWNGAINACDMPNNVMACMTAFCGADTTDYPCTGTSADNGGGACCRNGIWYSAGGDNTYLITGVEYNPAWEDRNNKVLCCEDDMMGNAQVFNDDADACCCEVDQTP